MAAMSAVDCAPRRVPSAGAYLFLAAALRVAAACAALVCLRSKAGQEVGAGGRLAGVSGAVGSTGGATAAHRK
jgi:hypothetical protein